MREPVQPERTWSASSTGRRTATG